MYYTRGMNSPQTPAPKPAAVAHWDDEFGCHYSWAQATKDNRRSRVLARIKRMGIPCDPQTLVIRPYPKEV